MKCDVCDHEFPIEGFYGGCCPKCGQEYIYDEGMMIVLSDEQKEVLRKHVYCMATLSEALDDTPPSEETINEVMQGAEESAIHREKLCEVPPRCPVCLTDQVQLIDWSSDIAEWKCRKNECRQTFKFELA